MKLNIMSWNVNGIRAIYRKNFIEFVEEYSPDILNVQEIKAQKDQIPTKIKKLENYNNYYFSAVRKGYSGVATLSKIKPNKVLYGINDEIFDKEGRVIICEYDKFSLFNIYFPNGKASKERLRYKMDFYYYFLEFLSIYMEEVENVIICGDVNTAHNEIDLARPKENENTSGFLIKEREWIDVLLSKGFIDAYRKFNKEPNNYTWWDYKTKARERNVGWRIDYFYVSNSLEKNLLDSYILNDVDGSDHCPIGIKLEL